MQIYKCFCLNSRHMTLSYAARDQFDTLALNLSRSSCCTCPLRKNKYIIQRISASFYVSFLAKRDLHRHNLAIFIVLGLEMQGQEKEIAYKTTYKYYPKTCRHQCFTEDNTFAKKLQNKTTQKKRTIESIRWIFQLKFCNELPDKR